MILDTEINSMIRKEGLESSRVALTAWKDFISAPVKEIAIYHEGGIKFDAVAKALSTVGIGIIAGRVD